jgi:histone deacetylase 11
MTSIILQGPDFDVPDALAAVHPFDPRKFSRAVAHAGVVATAVAFEPDDAHLARIHGAEYLASLARPDVVAAICEVPALAHPALAPVAHGLLRTMRRHVGNVAHALRLALEGRDVLSLGGGYHHAKPDAGEGFCAFADVACAIAAARAEGGLGNEDVVLHVDLDAHMGNGLAHCARDDRRLVLLDAFCRTGYPNADTVARDRIDVPLALPAENDDGPYLATVLPAVVATLEAVRPRLLVYNAGTDVLNEDPIGGFRLSEAGVRQRDRAVLAAARVAGVPMLAVTSGGYTDASHRLVGDFARHLLEAGR